MPAQTINFGNMPASQGLGGLAEFLQRQPLVQAQTEQAQAQAEKMKQESQMPFGGKMPTGDVGEAYWAELITNKLGPEHPMSVAANKALALKQQHKAAIEQRYNDLSNSLSYKMMPADAKKQAIAKVMGLGLDEQAASSYLAGGGSIEQLAKQKGIDPGKITPIFPLQGEEMKGLRQRQAFVNEISSLEGDINKAIEPYGRKIMGYSPAQIKDSIFGLNERQQARFLAANALQPELAALRLKAAGGQVGIGALEHLENAALSNTKVFESSISPAVRRMMNEEISGMIKKANAAYAKSNMESAGLASGNKEQEQIKAHKGGNYVKRNGKWYQL